MAVTDSSAHTSTADDADLMAVGRHCNAEHCGQLDFLPFKCSGCSKIFCMEHRQADAHSCPNKDAAQGLAMVCPMCARGVRVQPNEDPNVTLERHMQEACDPSNYAKVHKKKKCPVKNCREKLTTINSFECKECGATVCLKHRLGTDHACPGKPHQVSRASSLLRGTWGNLFGGSSSSANSANGSAAAAAAAAARPPQQPRPPPQQSAKAKLASVARQVSGSVQTQLGDYRASHQQKRTGTGGASAGPPARPETCPQCNQTFPTVQALIYHAAAAHQDGWQSGAALHTGPPAGGSATGATTQFERCPHCGGAFADPVQLVQHVEAVHGKRQATEVCVLC